MLVLTRKSGESIVVRHLGEEFTVRIDTNDKHARMKLVIDAPESFHVVRSELIGRAMTPKPKSVPVRKTEHEHSGKPCFVTDHIEGNRKVAGTIIGAEQHGERGLLYDWETTDGKRRYGYPAKQVTIVEKTSEVTLPENYGQGPK